MAAKYRLGEANKTDKLLALTVFATVLFGLVMIYSASIIVAHQNFLDDKIFVKKQALSAFIGFVLMILMASYDYHKWKKWAGIMFVLTFVLLVSVFFFSRGEINGAHRWITFAGQTFQPSELAKLTFIIYLSVWLVERKDKITDIVGTFVPFLLVLFMISILILAQPDFGTLSIILVSGLAVYYVAGLSFQEGVLGIVIAMIGLSIIFASPYRRARLTTFNNPNQDQSGSSYQINNISIAIGSGGLQGLGFGQSKQKRLFLPEPHTDSIFAITSEELGSIRSVFIIFLYFFIIYRGFSIARRSSDLLGRLMAVGITTWIGFQAFINLGSMLHIVPLVGVPLPFISYGGTNLMITLMAMGVLLNISSQVGDAEHRGRESVVNKRVR